MPLEVLINKLQFIPIAMYGIALWISGVYFVNWSTKCWFSSHVWPAIKDDPRAASDYHRFKLLSIALIVSASMIAAVLAP